MLAATGGQWRFGFQIARLKKCRLSRHKAESLHGRKHGRSGRPGWRPLTRPPGRERGRTGRAPKNGNGQAQANPQRQLCPSARTAAAETAGRERRGRNLGGAGLNGKGEHASTRARSGNSLHKLSRPARKRAPARASSKDKRGGGSGHHRHTHTRRAPDGDAPATCADSGHHSADEGRELGRQATRAAETDEGATHGTPPRRA